MPLKFIGPQPPIIGPQPPPPHNGAQPSQQMVPEHTGLKAL
jgi:hypothetical protein